jgi:ribonucleoside-diphosphate reductase alpha chain
MNKDFPQPICEQIWNRKYRLITPNPDINNDETVNDTWNRIAAACANSVTQHNVSNRFAADKAAFLSILEDFNFLPAGRITAGAGSGRNVTLFNCYVMGTVPDDINGIFESLKEAALTMQQGGGIGYDFSPLRPAGSPVKGVDADASGPLSFMDVWDAMCRTIMSAGARRGAMMATMRCDHPDIIDFIMAKQDAKRLRMFNMSVLCTEEFMKAVTGDLAWHLVHEKAPAVHTLGHDEFGKYVHKILPARELWRMIMESTYKYAEPGVIFIDRINQMNNLWYAENITSTNPCGEQPLPPYGACLLGSVNLAKMVEDPFTNPWINFNKITKTAKIAVRMLDSVIDMSQYPLPEQADEALNKRRMGIGITGMADMLFMMNHTYGSETSVKIAGEVMRTITLACYEESILLAQEYGPCPAVTTDGQRMNYVMSGFMKQMPPDICDGVIKHGIRNALLTSIAPTGTISMYAGNVSSGIEPIFADEYTRKVLHDNGRDSKKEIVQDYAVHLLGSLEIDPRCIMGNLVTAQTLTTGAHLRMLAAVQPWVDSSISKTINCPEDISFEDFQKIYTQAYNMGLKGCTTYRPNDVTGSVLSVESDEPEETVADAKPEPTALLAAVLIDPLDRPNNLKGTTYRLKWDGTTFYVTINDYEDHEGKTIPFEVFINSSDMADVQWTIALTRMISAVFRRGGPVKFIGEELKRISDPTGGTWVNKKFVPSRVALLGQTILDHVAGLDKRAVVGYDIPDLIEDRDITADTISVKDLERFKTMTTGTPNQCPGCSEYAMIVSNGCETCTSCGYSKCG